MISSLGNRVGFATSMCLGKTVLETEPSSQAALEVKAVVNEMLDIMK